MFCRWFVKTATGAWGYFFLAVQFRKITALVKKITALLENNRTVKQVRFEK